MFHPWNRLENERCARLQAKIDRQNGQKQGSAYDAAERLRTCIRKSWAQDPIDPCFGLCPPLGGLGLYHDVTVPLSAIWR